MTELQHISQMNGLPIYQILRSLDMPNEEHQKIKEFFDFLEQLQIIINENKHEQIESK